MERSEIRGSYRRLCPPRVSLRSTRVTKNEREFIMTELYVFPPSPRAFKVMAVANYLGIDAALRRLI